MGVCVLHTPLQSVLWKSQLPFFYYWVFFKANTECFPKGSGGGHPICTWGSWYTVNTCWASVYHSSISSDSLYLPSHVQPGPTGAAQSFSVGAEPQHCCGPSSSVPCLPPPPHGGTMLVGTDQRFCINSFMFLLTLFPIGVLGIFLFPELHNIMITWELSFLNKNRVWSAAFEHFHFTKSFQILPLSVLETVFWFENTTLTNG